MRSPRMDATAGYFGVLDDSLSTAAPADDDDAQEPADDDSDSDANEFL